MPLIWWFGAGAALGAAMAVGLERSRSRAARASAAVLTESTGVLNQGLGLAELEQVRRERAADRRRTRRAHRVARRAERLMSMVRCLAGSGLDELALRSVRAAIDDFEAETASFWVFAGRRTTLVASTGRRNTPPAIPVWPEATREGLPPRVSADGRMHYLLLRNELRVPVGCLAVGFDSPRSRRPAGLETYAAILGPFLAAELGRQVAEAEGFEDPDVPLAA
jgi:hypothetical protein